MTMTRGSGTDNSEDSQEVDDLSVRFWATPTVTPKTRERIYLQDQ